MSVICLNDDEIVHKKGMSIARDPMMRITCRPSALTPPSRSLRIAWCVVRLSMVVCMFASALSLVDGHRHDGSLYQAQRDRSSRSGPCRSEAWPAWPTPLPAVLHLRSSG